MRARLLLIPVLALLIPAAAAAQRPPAGPPAVGVVKAEPHPITETNTFVGRVQAINRVDLVARVTAFLDEQKFVEGAEVQKGDLLYSLEKPPFQADVQAKEAAVSQNQAQLQNAAITLARAQALINTPAGQQSNVDAARATQLTDAAQVLAAQAQLEQSKINLAYTDIHAPISGKIGRTSVTPGNVVSPSSGVLATIVSQDPMYVTFSISQRSALELRQKYATAAGFKAVVIRLRLPDGRIYSHTGNLDFVDNTISANTDTIVLRGRIPNPPISNIVLNGVTLRELTDGEFVTVLLEGVEPVQLLSIPRAAVLSDQQGDYVFTVDSANKAQRTDVKLGATVGTLATVISGLKEGDTVISEGIQRVRPGAEVAPAPASPAPPNSAQPGAAP
jgi:membrane fusion protein (multidrug efflux system)